LASITFLSCDYLSRPGLHSFPTRRSADLEKEIKWGIAKGWHLF